MDNDALRHQVAEAIALAEQQFAEITKAVEKQSTLRASAAAADGLVEVTVDAQGRLATVAIGESYLDEHEFEELGNHITEASRAAAQEAARRVAAMMAPISERRKAFPGQSELLKGAAPDLRDLMPPWPDPVPEGRAPQSPDDNDAGGDDTFPTVRR